MAGRERVRSSARLSGGASAAASTPSASEHVSKEQREAAAALRRARAARAAERAREVEDSPRVLREKCRQLAKVLQEAKHLVVYTGAGISTAADIPDYRGPRGVWTRLQRGESVGRVEVSRARPTFTHMALTALWRRGALKFVVSQNCDGLHLRAGLPRRALAELHGDMFAERCPACRRVYLRAFDTTERTARHAHATRRLCHDCGRELRDTIVHFGERGRAAWPLNWAGALRHAGAADVVLCLGSSLKVLRRYPRLWRMQRAPSARPALYIVNLQWTPKDAVAALKINARCDAVMAQVARRLRLRVPRYDARADPLLAHAEPLAPPEAHTTRRPLLTRPAGPPPPAAHYDLPPPSSAESSASDSDEELPLCKLARRLRPPPSPPPAPPLLHSFRVSMRSGDATILLRSEHAPTDPPPPEPPPPAPRPAPCPAPGALRSFRMPRPPPRPPDLNGTRRPPPLTNGHRPPGDPVKANGLDEEIKTENGTWSFGSKLRKLLEFEPKIECDAKPGEPGRLEPAGAREDDAKEEEERIGEESASLAAAIIRRAVLVCRAQLYPGLHTILAPPPAPAPACDWCARHYSARRCLWYGPPRLTPPERRAWRRERARRALCACCEPGAGPEPRDAAPGAGGGWYGKGYRKGRRRRR
ncbi:unnamed protein product [Colias eurytheme]|nr:unnamed protein product [Colias eurytheme]